MVAAFGARVAQTDEEFVGQRRLIFLSGASVPYSCSNRPMQNQARAGCRPMFNASSAMRGLKSPMPTRCSNQPRPSF